MTLSKAGDQVPIIPSLEVVGKADKESPEQIGATAVKVGLVLVVMVTVTFIKQPLLSVYVMEEAPLAIPVTRPAASIVATAVLEEIHGETAAGVPEPTSCEVVPLQKVRVPLIVGLGLTVISIVVSVAHCPAVGVKL